MDNEMGVMSGVEAATAIRVLNFTGTIALVSGSIFSHEQRERLVTIFDYFFVKGGSPSWTSLFMPC